MDGNYLKADLQQTNIWVCFTATFSHFKNVNSSGKAVFLTVTYIPGIFIVKFFYHS